MRSNFFFFLSLGLANLVVSATEVSSTLRAIEQIGSLAEAEKEQLGAELAKERFRALSAEDRRALQLAAVKFSEVAIGRRPDGELKGVKDPIEKRLLHIAGAYLNQLAPNELIAHASAGELYGTIPDDAPRLTRTLSLDASVPFWHSTALYAVPGEAVEIRVPPQWVDQGLKVHISGHRDHLPDKRNVFHRLPQKPQRTFDIDDEVTAVGGAFGGAIYIDFGKKQRPAKLLEVTISNAIQAPGYVLGKSTKEHWQTMRQAPGPYAELVTPRIAFSIPSEWIRDLEDPEPLLTYWDQIVKWHDELGGYTDLRKAPERANIDVQISVGLLHAGYPMQGPQKVSRRIMDLEELKTTGNWGWFHELGHEAQRRPDKAWGWNNPYTFDNGIEVTVNLFSAHALNRLGIQYDSGWGWTTHPEKVVEQARKVTDTEKTYKDGGFAGKLSMYLLIRDEFGWQPIAKVLRSYSDDQDKDPSKLPKSDQEKRDEFCRRMSRELRRNLYPYMAELYGIEVSPEINKELKSLKPWLPKGFAISQ